MGKYQDLSEFDRSQIVMATGSDHFCTDQYLSKVVQGRNSDEPTTGSQVAQLTDACREQRLALYEPILQMG